MAREVNARTVVVNGETIGITKNPKYKRGGPQVKTNTSMVGDSIEVSQSVNVTEALGEVTLPLRHTAANLAKIEDWQNNIGLNSIRLLDRPLGTTLTFNEMSIEEDPEIDLSGEEVEVTFKGRPAV